MKNITRTSFSVFMTLIFCWAISSLLKPAEVKAEIYYGFTSGTIQNGYGSISRYMAMHIPEDNMRIVSFGHRASNSCYIRAAIYVGGVSGNPAGAAMVFDSGQVYHPGIPGSMGWPWYDFPIDPPIDLAKDTQFGLAIKVEDDDPAGSGSGIFNYLSSGYDPGSLGDCDQTYDLAEDTDTTNPFNSTLNAVTDLSNTNHYYVTLVKYPAIDSVVTDQINNGQTDIYIYGSAFEGLDEFGIGSSKIWLTENNDFQNPGTIVEQTYTSWADTTISFNASFGGLLPGTTAYLWVENSDGQVNNSGIPLVLNTSCGTAPLEVADSLSIFPDDGIYIPSDFTMSMDFEDPDNPIYGCLYSIDDGTTWLPGSVSGAGPSYTCTANDSAAGGSVLNVRMKATSCGGTSASSQIIQRTVDADGPTSTMFTTTPGDTICTLDWDAVDNGTGMHPTEPFEICWSTSSTSVGCTPYYQGNRLYIGMDKTLTHTGLTNGETYYYWLNMKDAYDNTRQDPKLSCTLNATPWGVVYDGYNPPNNFATSSAVNQILSTFILSMTNGTGSSTDLVTAIEVTGTNTANISNVHIYRDNGSVSNTYDPSDTLIDSASFNGDVAAFSSLNITVTEANVQYLITADISSAPTDGESITAYVSSVTAQTYSVSNYDNQDASITIDSTPPSTKDNTPSAWKTSEITITFTATDGAGSGIDTATGYLGCLGAGCDPAVLGENKLTTACGDGNICTYEVRYFTRDRADNSETIKISPNLARVDRKPPSGGALTIFDNAEPIVLHWDGISDDGSGINYYRLWRVDGATPPADCNSGLLRYQGTDTSFDDRNSFLVPGQSYSYRLCVYDIAGNVAGDYTGTAVAGEVCSSGISCDNCHGVPPSDMPGAHSVHEMMGCWNCHREGAEPYHVDGIITIEPSSGSSQGDLPWPTAGGGVTCGGQGIPVGGDPNGGMEGCHMGTTNYPDLTPTSECDWLTGSCSPPDYNDCNSCHGIPVGWGMTGYEYFAGAHEIHGGVDCMACHDETGPDSAHINGMVPVTPDTVWNGPNPQPWPGAGPATCGGMGTYIGGDPQGGAWACHAGTPTNPILEPSWECVWDVMPYCIDPTMP